MKRGKYIGRRLQRLSEAQKWRCYYCGEQMQRRVDHERCATRDHVIPVARLHEYRYKAAQNGVTFPNHMPDNIVAACKWCNNRKADMSEEEFRARYLQNQQ